MMKTLKLLPTLCFFVALVTSVPAVAYEIDNVTVPDSCQIDTNLPKLQLQGAGIRTKLIFDIYVGAIYTEHTLKTPAEVLADPGAKRMWLHVVYKDITPEKFQKAWLDGIEANNDEEFISKNQEKIDQLMEFFSANMLKGDIIMIDYLPGKGTRVTINNKVKGTIPGDAFYALVLSTWMGDHPPSKKFQNALFDLSAAN